MITVKVKHNDIKVQCPACHDSTHEVVMITFGSFGEVESNPVTLILCTFCADGLSKSIKLAQVRS